MNKKFIAISAVFAICFSLTGCNQTNENDNKQKQNNKNKCAC